MDDLRRVIERLYPEQAERIVAEIAASIDHVAPAARPAPDLYWYRFLQLYFIYPDSIAFGSGSPLARLVPYLQHVKDLGCNALHILPFLASPLVDAGFDVSDYLQVRPDLGAMGDLDAVIAEAERLQLHLFMDLVANHVSEEHDWFRKAQAGDPRYRDYFITTRTKPDFVEMRREGSAILARYIVDGEPVDVGVVFPEFVGEIPHWRQEADGTWYYHTFYPQQPDLNWHNPEVFLEFARVVAFWTARGFSLRLDAVSFIGQGAYKRTGRPNPFAADLGIALREVARRVNPNTAFLVETYEPVPAIARSFGTPGKRRAELAYNFHLCTHLWVALAQGNVEYIWKTLDEVRDVPVHAEWMNFLRNHDELSLGYLTDPLLSAVQDALMPYGASFRSGTGISGRTFSMLRSNEERFLNAYFLLASFPGGMLIPFGDEFGVENVPIPELPEHLRADTRNINRGPLTGGERETPRARHITPTLAEVLQKRDALREYVNVWPARLPSPSGVFAAAYHHGTSELLAVANITGESQRVELPDRQLEDYRVVLSLGQAKPAGTSVELGPYAGIWLEQ